RITGIKTLKTRHHVQKGRLARPARPADDHEIARRCSKGHVVHGAYDFGPVLECDSDGAEIDHRSVQISSSNPSSWTWCRSAASRLRRIVRTVFISSPKGVVGHGTGVDVKVGKAADRDPFDGEEAPVLGV